MLEQVMGHIRNFFVYRYHTGDFSIRDGNLFPHDFILDGQRFYITGSALNDGVYTYHTSEIKDDDDGSVVNLADEEFVGIVYALAVPPLLLALVSEIKEWVGKFGDVMENPYQSESFNGYSYTKSWGQNNGGSSATWQGVFRDRLNQWRKVGG